MRLSEHERVEIMPWQTWLNGNYNEEPVNTANSVEICEWCRQLNKYHLPNDTGNVSDRFMIGFYQMCYIPSLINNYELREWGEAIASSMIHFIACFECCGIVCYDKVKYEYCNPNINSMDLYYRVLRHLTHSARQVYYKAKGRKNRYDGYLLDFRANQVITNLIALHNSKKPHLDLSDSFILAMAKLQAKELNTH